MCHPFCSTSVCAKATELFWAVIITMNPKNQRRRAHAGMPILLD